MVAKKRPLWPAEPCRRPAGGTGAASPQLCWCLLHPSCRAVACPPGGCTWNLVEQQPLPERAAQRGDHRQLVRPGSRRKPANPESGHGCHHGSPCPTKAPVETQAPRPPGPAQRCHCHTLLYGSSRHWCQPWFSRAAVHPVIIGVPLMIVQTSCDQSTHSFSWWERGWGALLGLLRLLSHSAPKHSNFTHYDLYKFSQSLVFMWENHRWYIKVYIYTSV